MLLNCTKESKEVIVTGDINVIYLKKDKHEVKTIFDLFGFFQLISEPTRTTIDSSSLIDVTLTNKPENISKTTVIPSGLSDHDMIGCSRKVNFLKTPHRTINCRNYSRYDKTSIQNELKSYTWERLGR